MVHKHFQKEEPSGPEARLRRVIEQSPLGVHVFTPDGRSLQANGVWNEIWNLRKEEEPEGTNIFEDDQLRAAGLTAYIEDAVASASVVVTPPLRHDPARTGREGEPRWLRAYVYPVKNDAGRVIETALLLEDVTGRKEAEEALQRSESRLAEAQRIAHVGNWEYGVKKDEAYWSDEMYRLSGHAPQEFVPRYSTFLRSIHHDDRETVRRAVRQALYIEEQSGVEYRIVQPDGTVRNIYSQYEVFRDEAGEAVRIVGISHDITERKEAEEALKESQERYRAVVEQSAESIWLFDPVTKQVLESNTSFQEMLGYTAEELRGMTNYDFVAHSDEDIDATVWQKVREGENPTSERKYRRKDGRLLNVEVSGTLISYQGKEVVCSVARDLTDRKLVEEELRKSAAYNKAILDASPDLMFLFDRAGEVLDLKVAGKESKLYVPPETIADKKLGDLLPAEIADMSLGYIARALDTGETQVCEYQLSVPEGVRDFEARLVKSGTNEVLSVVRDVTERKRSEELLRQQSAAMTASMDGVAILDENGAYTYVNNAHAQTFGYDDSKELLGKNWKVLHDEREVERLERAVEPMLRAHGQWRGEAIGKKRDGSTFLQEVSLTVIEGGGTVCVVRDITERKRVEDALKQSEERYRAMIEQSTDGIYLADADAKRIQETNPSMQRMFGYTVDEFRGMEIYDLVAHEREDIDATIRHTLAERSRFVGERKYRQKDGFILDVEVSASVISYGGRDIICTIVRDVTERKETEARLRESEERFRDAFENAPIGVALVNLNGHYFKVNQALCEMLGYSEEELLEKTSLEIIHPEDHKISEDHMRRAIEDELGSYTLERRYIHADGRVVWNLTSVSLIQDSRGDPSHFVCLHQDTTERKALEDRLEHQAFHDSLTGLANRALFMNRLEQALARLDRRRGPIAVLFVDLDNFKYVNDSLSHEAGDRLLVEAGERLKECVRPEDTVSRFGGDEFAVLLEGIADLSGASRVAERITEALTAPFNLEGREVFVGTSMGIAPATKAPDEPGDLLRNADMALYRAKEKGKARYEFFDESIGAEALKRLELEGALRKALQHEEFRIHYQPKISVSENKIVSLEALVRWEHPERGLLEPDEFLPLAEETSLIVPLGEWVLDEVCRQGWEWQERFADRPPPRVCTNISARQFFQTDLAGRVNESLRKSGLRARGLSLEIAESVLMEDVEDNVEKLTALKELGINIVIDDFGTAYSALSKLKNFPLNILKIDRSLTVKLGEEPEDKAIVAAMINLAQALGWAVTAHGVENEEQLAVLRELGCDIVQGYYFTRPVTSEEATALLEKELSTTTGA